MQERLNVVRLSEDEKSVVILDQTKLPNHEEYLDLEDAESMWNAIKLLQVRGAPAIGVFAGYALAVLAGQIADLPRKEFLEMLQEHFRRYAVSLVHGEEKERQHRQNHPQRSQTHVSGSSDQKERRYSDERRHRKTKQLSFRQIEKHF